MRTQHPVIRAIGVSHTACKDEFRRNIRSHSWSVFLFFSSIVYAAVLLLNSCWMAGVLVFHFVVPSCFPLSFLFFSFFSSSLFIPGMLFSSPQIVSCAGLLAFLFLARVLVAVGIPPPPAPYLLYIDIYTLLQLSSCGIYQKRILVKTHVLQAACDLRSRV